MHRDPAVRDGGFDGCSVFLIAAASISKLPVNDLDRQPSGVIGLNRVRQLKQFPLRGLGRREGALSVQDRRQRAAR